jgi:hypothetical protein
MPDVRALPNAAQAIIQVEKLRDYLLSPGHPAGRWKATFFGTLGYTRNEWIVLDRALRNQHLVVEADPLGNNGFGDKYSITAPLKGPNGSTAMVCSIWIVRAGEDAPRFVTAYPIR